MITAPSNHSLSLPHQTIEPPESESYSIETVAQMTQLPRHRIAVYCRRGLISTLSNPEKAGWRFDLEAIRTLRRIEALREGYNINLVGLRIITELQREVERLRDELRTIKRKSD